VTHEVIFAADRSATHHEKKHPTPTGRA